MERERQECIHSQEIWMNAKTVVLKNVEDSRVLKSKDVRSEDYHNQMCLELRGRNMDLGRLALKRGGMEVITQKEQWFLVPTIAREPEEGERSLFVFLYFSNM